MFRALFYGAIFRSSIVTKEEIQQSPWRGAVGGLLSFLFSNHTRPEDGPIEEGRNMSSLLHI